MLTKKREIFYYTANGKLVAEKIEQAWFLFFLYWNPIGKLLRIIFNKKIIAKFYGLSQNWSLSRRKIVPFIKKHNINMEQFEKKVSEYRSFNDFFVRKLKHGIREISVDPKIFISPADSKLIVIEQISQKIIFFVKNEKFNLSIFLGDNDLANKYQDGTLMIFRLAPYDYHRFHFPVDCVPGEPKRISGIYDSVNPIAYKSGLQPLLHNERYLTILKTEQFSDIVAVSVGAMLVGKIIHTFIPGEKYKKGDEMGFFEFGGSTLVLLFKKNIIVPKREFIEHSKLGFETEVKMGQAINE